MAGIGAVFGIIGSLVSAAGTIAAGKAQNAAAKFEATQLEMKAAEERAAAQREAGQQHHQTAMLQSRGQAVAAASGFGATDPTVMELAGDVEQAGAYREGMIRYGGEERARGLRTQAEATRMSGKAAQRGSYFSAVGTLAGGFGSMLSKYGGAGPPGEDNELDLLRGGSSSGFYYG